MATKSEVLIQAVQLEVTRLQGSLEGLQDQVEGAKLMELRERFAVIDSAIAELKKRSEEDERRGERLAVLESQYLELKKHLEERERRWWQFWVGVSAVGLTFVANSSCSLPENRIDRNVAGSEMRRGGKSKKLCDLPNVSRPRALVADL